MLNQKVAQLFNAPSDLNIDDFDLLFLLDPPADLPTHTFLDHDTTTMIEDDPQISIPITHEPGCLFDPF